METTILPTPETCPSAFKPNVPFPYFLAGLTAWPLLKILIQYTTWRLNPTFYEDLKLDVRKKYDLYFGTWLGVVFKTVGLAACATATFTTSAETDIFGLVRPLSVAEQWCWGCRAVIYIQELPHVASLPEMVIHHVLSIAAMLAVLGWDIPRRQFYIVWAGLWNEVLNNVRRIVKMHGGLTPARNWWFAFVNCGMLLLLRITGTAVAFVWTFMSGTTGIPLLVNAGCLAIYQVYMVQMVMWEVKKEKIVELDMGGKAAVSGGERSKPAQVKFICGKWTTDLYGYVLGAGLLVAGYAATVMYYLDVVTVGKKGAVAQGELLSIVEALFCAAAAGLVGSCVSGLVSSWWYGQGKRMSARQGEILAPVAAGAVLLLSPMASTVDKRKLIEAVALSIPLLGAVRQIGCYLDGTGGAFIANPVSDTKTGKDTSNDEKAALLISPAPESVITPPTSREMPPQFVASLVNLILYVDGIMLYLLGYLSLRTAGGLTLAFHGFLRMAFEYQQAHPPLITSATWTGMLSPHRKSAFTVWSTFLSSPFTNGSAPLHILAGILIAWPKTWHDEYHTFWNNAYWLVYGLGLPVMPVIMDVLVSQLRRMAWVRVLCSDLFSPMFKVPSSHHARYTSDSSSSAGSEHQEKQAEKGKHGHNNTSTTKDNNKSEKRRGGGARGLKKFMNGRVAALAASVGVVIVMVVGIVFDLVPEVGITSVEEARKTAEAAAWFTSHPLLQTAVSWQVWGASAVVAGLPVLLQRSGGGVGVAKQR